MPLRVPDRMGCHLHPPLQKRRRENSAQAWPSVKASSSVPGWTPSPTQKHAHAIVQYALSLTSTHWQVHHESRTRTRPTISFARQQTSACKFACRQSNPDESILEQSVVEQNIDAHSALRPNPSKKALPQLDSHTLRDSKGRIPGAALCSTPSRSRPHERR